MANQWERGFCGRWNCWKYTTHVVGSSLSVYHSSQLPIEGYLKKVYLK